MAAEAEGANPSKAANPKGIIKPSQNYEEAVRPANFQTVATAGEPYCLGPQWHLLV